MDYPEAIVSRILSAQTRVYYFDIYPDHKGELYLSISEIPTKKMPGQKERRRVFVHSANIVRFMESLQEVVETLKKNDAER